jgi:hypothetical protein
MTQTRYHQSAPGLGDLLAGRKHGQHMERTGNPCWRDSYDVDDERCQRFVHPVDRDEVAAILTVVEQHNLETKDPGKRCGVLRMWGTAVMRYLLRESLSNKGVCCPSQAQIAQALRIARSTVVATLEALASAGFLEWTRRTVIDDDGSGPRRKQTSNLYRFILPKHLAWRVSKFLVKRFGRKPGIPRSIAAALAPAALEARRVRLIAGQEARRRKRPSIVEALGRLLNGASPSPMNGLS